MKRHAFALALLAGFVASAQASVPQTVGFSARLVDDKTGQTLTGTHHFHFVLFDARTGGTSQWVEDQDVMVDDGLVFVALGEIKALDATVFRGQRLFLEVTLDDAVMDPRLSIDSVPYATRSDVARDSETVGGLGSDALQKRITASCGSGSVMTGVNADGTVTCQLAGTGDGTINGVNAVDGLTGGGSAGTVTVGLIRTCAAGELLKFNGATWVCAPDANSGGDITSVTTSNASGLQGGVASGDAALSLLTTCVPGQLLKWNGTAWACANDIDTDTNAGGDITSVTTSNASGLQGGVTSGDAALSLLTNCNAGQLLKWNGVAWGCANDIDTDTDTNSGGTVQNVVAGNGLTGGGGTATITVDVVGGTGLTVNANNIQLDTSFTDGRYVNSTGDTMIGTLDMNQQRLTNRGCPTVVAYKRIGAGLCTEDNDGSGFTFGGCSNRCRVQGTHMCRSSEMRAIIASGVTLTSTTLLDWVDDQDAAGSALFVNATNAETMDAARVTSTSSFCRCCADVE